jgi:predicted metal-dependent phosphoesterase TrpH
LLQGHSVRPIGTNVLKVDLHLHTSEDPEDVISHDVYQLIDRAAELGFNALAITLHNRVFTDPRLTGYARERGIMLVPGVERTIEKRHVLLLNFPNGTDYVRTFDDLAALRSRTNGVVVAPHPFFPHGNSLRSRLIEHPDLFDAVEWSYFWTRGLNFNAKAEKWAREQGKPVVASSDLHDIRQFGRTFSYVFAEPDVDAICAAVREGRVSIQTSPVPKLELARVVTGMLRRGNRPPVAVDSPTLAATT